MENENISYQQVIVDNNYYIEEDILILVKARGKLFEQSVEEVWNKWDGYYKDILIKENRKEILNGNNMLLASVYAVQELKKYIKEPFNAEKISSSPISKNWNGNSQGEPKTDVKIGDYHISMKYGASQIMSSSPEEVKTILSLCVNSNDNNNILINRIYDNLNKLIEVDDKGKIIAKKTIITSRYLDKKIEKYRVKGVLEVLKDENDDCYRQLMNIKEIHNKLQQDFEQLFKENKEIKHKFINEAMTGKIKYNESDGSATHILCYSKEKKKHIFKQIDDNLIKDISDKLNISMSFKSGGTIRTKEYPKGKRIVWSCLRIIMLSKDIKNNIYHKIMSIF